MIGSAPDNSAAADGLASRALPAWWFSFMPGNGALNGHGTSPGTGGRPAAPTAWAARDGHVGGTSPDNGQSLPVACLVPRPPHGAGSRDSPLVDRAVRIVAQARLQGGLLSQAALARQLRAEGYSIANDRLRWLATVSGLDPAAGQMQ